MFKELNEVKKHIKKMHRIEMIESMNKVLAHYRYFYVNSDIAISDEVFAYIKRKELINMNNKMFHRFDDSESDEENIESEENNENIEIAESSNSINIKNNNINISKNKLKINKENISWGDIDDSNIDYDEHIQLSDNQKYQVHQYDISPKKSKLILSNGSIAWVERIPTESIEKFIQLVTGYYEIKDIYNFKNGDKTNTRLKLCFEIIKKNNTEQELIDKFYEDSCVKISNDL